MEKATTTYPLIMTEDYWANTHLSIVRHTGRVRFNNHEYIIVNKDGLDIFACSIKAEKEGREKAIEPGEPADLCLMSLVPAYHKLGRDRIIQAVKDGLNEDAIKELAGLKRKRKKPEK